MAGVQHTPIYCYNERLLSVKPELKKYVNKFGMSQNFFSGIFFSCFKSHLYMVQLLYQNMTGCGFLYAYTPVTGETKHRDLDEQKSKSKESDKDSLKNIRQAT